MSLFNWVVIAATCCIPAFGYVALQAERKTGNARWATKRFGMIWMASFVALALLTLGLLLPRLI